MSLGLLLSIIASQSGPALAQTDAFNRGGSDLYTLPENAVVGSTAERTNAYNNLSEAEKSEAATTIQGYIDVAVPPRPESKTFTLSFVNDLGVETEISSRADIKPSTDFYNRDRGCKTCPPPPVDADGDSLSDSFENALADGFTPYYFVSGGERNGTGFTRFHNSVPQTYDLNQTFPATPPISHFRVKPLGFFYRSDGIQYGVIQLDYLTLWNRDDSLVSGDLCVAAPIINTSTLLGHNLDNERSALLVAAPVSNGNYNTDLQSYKVYEAYTAGHEGKLLFDTSMRFHLSTPYPFGSHIKLVSCHI